MVIDPTARPTASVALDDLEAVTSYSATTVVITTRNRSRSLLHSHAEFICRQEDLGFIFGCEELESHFLQSLDALPLQRKT